MGKHSELDNTIAEFWRTDDYVLAALEPVTRMLDGNCMALGHARRYVEEAIVELGVPRNLFSVTCNDGEVVVNEFKEDGKQFCSWLLLRWKPVRGED